VRAIKLDADYRHTTTGVVVIIIDVTADFVQVWCDAENRFWMVDRDRFSRYFQEIQK